MRILYGETLLVTSCKKDEKAEWFYMRPREESIDIDIIK